MNQAPESKYQKAVKTESQYQDPAFRERLAIVIGNQAPFAWAARVGISKGAFARIWNRGTVPSAAHLRRIHEATGYSIDWLLTGSGPRKCPPVRGQEGEAGRAGADVDFVALPWCSDSLPVQQGEGQRTLNEAENRQVLLFKSHWLRVQLQAEFDRLCLIQARQDDMDPTLRPGDIAILECGADQQLPCNGIYYLKINGTSMFKRLQRTPDGTIQISSDNSQYGSFTITDLDDTHIRVIGRVVCVVKRL